MHRKILAKLVALALVITMMPAVAFAGTTGDDGASGTDSTTPEAPDCTTVEWNGFIWDIIGYNFQGIKHGVAGDTKDTVTLLLDEKSYNSSTHDTDFDSTGPYSNNYAGSALQSKITSIYNDLEDKSNIVARTLTGGSAPSNATEGYTGNTIAGKDANSQYLWPLSVTEASQLKASVRTYGDDWWLRSPGNLSDYEFDSHDAASVSSDGNVDSDGDGVYDRPAARPALYLNLSSPISTSHLPAIISQTLKIGAYDETLKVTDTKGYTWDVVGINNGFITQGVATATSGYATLLLSNSSDKTRFPRHAPTQGNSYIIMNHDFELGSSGNDNDYVSSGLKDALNSAADALTQSEYAGKILPRNLEGGAKYNDGTEKVAGAGVNAQSLWPLSFTEAKALTNQQRTFGNSWWLRSPGNDSSNAATVDSDGNVDSDGDGVYDRPAARPALYLNLSSSIFTSLSAADPNWQSKVGDSSSGTVNPAPIIKHTITFNANGGTVSPTAITINNNAAIGKLPIPTRAGYTFAGWWSAATGGRQISTITAPNTSTSYFAHWTANTLLPTPTPTSTLGPNSGKATTKPDANTPSEVVNNASFKAQIKFIAPSKKTVETKKSATIKLTAYKNVFTNTITIDKEGKKLRLKVDTDDNIIKIKAGSKVGKAKITVILGNGNKKTITVTVKKAKEQSIETKSEF